MSLTLCAAVLMTLALLYIPGYLAARAFSIGRFAAVAIAPMLSACALAIIGVVLKAAGVICEAFVLPAICIALCLVLWVITWAVRRRHAPEPALGARADRARLLLVDGSARPWLMAALYIAVALAVTAVVFGTVLDTPDAFSRKDDTTVHLGLIRGFLDTGTYSTLSATSYMDQGVQGGFYPAQWHVLGAVVASAFGNSAPIASNALIFAFVVFVFPLAMCLFFLKVFPDRKWTRYAGALFVTAFSGFPWGFLVFGQLLPNMMAFMFVPLVLAVIIEATTVSRKADIVKLVGVAVIGIAAIALAQPNGVFTLGIWAGLYLVSRIFFEPGSEKAVVDGKRIGLTIGLIVAMCALWAAMYLAPFMQSVLQTNWGAFLKPVEAAVAALTFMFTTRTGIHPFLSIVVLVGVIYACRHRRYLWMVVACALALILYWTDAATDGPAKSVLTGFWYTDYYRTGAMASLFAMPLAALGFASIFVALRNLFVRKQGKATATGPALEAEPAGTPVRKWTIVAPAGILLAIFAVCQFLPISIPYSGDSTVKMGLIKVHGRLESDYSWSKGLTLEEVGFVKQATADLPAGTLIINVPRDGSAWLYGVEGTNAFFRRTKGTGLADAETSKTIRLHLRDVASNEEVQKILQDYDARYVLMLDVKSSKDPTVTDHRYNEKDWVGIESIDESTPGFTLLLSDGDMRFYRIDAIDGTA